MYPRQGYSSVGESEGGGSKAAGVGVLQGDMDTGVWRLQTITSVFSHFIYGRTWLDLHATFDSSSLVLT